MGEFRKRVRSKFRIGVTVVFELGVGGGLGVGVRFKKFKSKP